MNRIMGSMVGRTALRLVLGQFLSMCMSVTGLFTSLLVEDNSSLPLLQSVTAYVMIACLFSVLYMTFVVRNREWINWRYVSKNDHRQKSAEKFYDLDQNPQQQRQIVVDREGVLSAVSSPSPVDGVYSPHQHETNSQEKNKSIGTRIVSYFSASLSEGYKGVGASLWRFALIALIDLEANFAVVYAYQYTDITSVQLLDCSAIVWVMILSRFLLGARYKALYHIAGAAIAVVGMALLVVFDATNMNRESGGDNNGGGNNTFVTTTTISPFLAATTTATASPCDDNGGSSSRNIVLGDMLCIISSLMYAISNVACERLVKKSVVDTEGAEKKNSTASNAVDGGRGAAEINAITECRVKNPTEKSALQSPTPTTLSYNNNGNGGGKQTVMNSNDLAYGATDQRSEIITATAGAATTVNDNTTTLQYNSMSAATDVSMKAASVGLGYSGDSGALRESGGGVIVTQERKNNNTSSNDNAAALSSASASASFVPKPNRYIPSLEWIVIIEYLFWMPVFGAIFGTIQFWATQEYRDLPPFFDGTTLTSSSSFSLFTQSNCSSSSSPAAFERVASGESYVDIYYQLGFGAAMLVIYTLMPVLFFVASATFANLSLLTSDIFSIFWNVTVFNIYPKPTFFISFVLILAGVVIFDTNGFEALRLKRASKKLGGKDGRVLEDGSRSDDEEEGGSQAQRRGGQSATEVGGEISDNQ